MNLWMFLLGMTLLLPAGMLLLGANYLHNPNQNPRFLFAYRSHRSQASDAAWQFAHRFMGRLFLVCGGVGAAGALWVMLPLRGQNLFYLRNAAELTCALQLVPVLLAAFCTEHALKRHFDADGQPRSE